MESSILDLDVPVRIVDYGGTGPSLLLVHGLGGSAENWTAVGESLSDHGRVVALDLAGFGKTPPGERGSTVDANADLVLSVIDDLDLGPTTLVGNSMGGLISILAAVASPDRIERVVLVNPALPVARWRPLNPEVLLKLLAPLIPVLGPAGIQAYKSSHTPEEETAETLAMITADPTSVPADARAAMAAMTRSHRTVPWTIPSFIQADRSLARRIFNPRRFAALVDRVTQPALLIHGMEDPLVSIDSARWLAAKQPGWDFVAIEGVGHVPMLEAPEMFVELVAKWLAVTSNES
jgi:pimeloyl-ACP methyl ester carboxylesterase